jgi:hypothetical protein
VVTKNSFAGHSPMSMGGVGARPKSPAKAKGSERHCP